MVKFGRFEVSGFGGFTIVGMAIVGIVSLVDRAIVAAVKWRRMRGLEKLAAMANTREGIEVIATAIAEDYSDEQIVCEDPEGDS